MGRIGCWGGGHERRARAGINPVPLGFLDSSPPPAGAEGGEGSGSPLAFVRRVIELFEDKRASASALAFARVGLTIVTEEQVRQCMAAHLCAPHGG